MGHNMAKKPTGSGTSDRIIGPKVIAAIAAVDGLYLTAASKKRLAALKASGLTPDQQRTEIVRAYMPVKDHSRPE